MEKFKKIAENFKVDGEFLSCEPYGEGHINVTYLLKTKSDKINLYILQKINSKLFTDVPKLMNNIKLVTEFAREKIIERGGDPLRETMKIVETKDGNTYYQDGEDYYRIYVFITNATAYQKVEKDKDFYSSAVAFGNFANLLAEFDAKKLYEPLPFFHDTRKRFENLLKAIKEDKMGRAKEVKEEIDFALARKNIVGLIADKLDSGEIPTKVTHNDTKLNNVMIDDATSEPMAVIDLDTIMPGSICYDFGDSIRFGCNPADEDERDLTKVVFSLRLFDVYTKGYISAVKGSITKAEADNLCMGAILMTYECGIRFLTDYLEGDTYFRIKRPSHNLDRCRSQFKLVSDMESLLPKMQEIVANAMKTV